MNYLNQLTKTLDGYYAKAPVLPKKWTDLIVKYAPILVLIGAVLGLIFGVLGLLATLSFLGLAATVAPLGGVAYGMQYMVSAVVSALVLLVTGVLYLMAYPALKARKIKGWNLIFYALLLSVLSSIVSLSVFGIVESIIGALIGYYFLYQVKSYYK
jgi:hypothetical protein